MSDAMNERIDRLYQLMPVVYRQRDLALGFPLRDLLRAIAEQVNLIEDDIAAMYDDWFIETCRDWVVPYIADLVGYQVVHAGVIETEDAEARLRTSSVVPRRDVANYVRDVRRRGTLALLENLAADSAGFSSRAVEFRGLLGRTQSLNHLGQNGYVADLRDGERLELIDSPFDALAHTIDVRRVNASRCPGRHNIPNAGEFVWRLRAFPVTKAPAALVQQRSSGYAFYTFSALGNDSPLFTSAVREADPSTIAAEINVPTPIRRRALELRRDDYYGPAKSFAIWLDNADEPVAVERIIAADLTNWKYRPADDQVVVDPQLGRIVLPKEADAIAVSYHYGFSADVGAHESARILTQPRGTITVGGLEQHTLLYRVGANEEYAKVALALAQWKSDAPQNAVIEIADNGIYTEALALELPTKATLQLRAANRCRPLLRIIDYEVPRGERLHVLMHEHARFTLDGIMLAGRPLRVEGAGDHPPAVRVAIRRCTLIPGWDLTRDNTPAAPDEASLELENVRGTVSIDRSILGTIAVVDETAKGEPVGIRIRDSIVDATAPELDAVVGPNGGYAWASLTIVRSTVIGQVLAHALELGENSIFESPVKIVRRQNGCVRFCYVAADSRTPRRYHCQPDLVTAAAPKRAAEEQRRVAPEFTSTTFGDPGYCQLATGCAIEIVRGADDESEMGAFHDLFTPQRLTNLQARLDQSTPAGMETGIIYAD